MILFTVLLITLAILAVITVFAVAAGGAAFIVLFGDVIVCAVLIMWIMKCILKKKKKGSK